MSLHAGVQRNRRCRQCVPLPCSLLGSWHHKRVKAACAGTVDIRCAMCDCLLMFAVSYHSGAVMQHVAGCHGGRGSVAKVRLSSVVSNQWEDRHVGNGAAESSLVLYATAGDTFTSNSRAFACHITLRLSVVLKLSEAKKTPSVGPTVWATKTVLQAETASCHTEEHRSSIVPLRFSITD